ncbi:MAG TPA: ferrochelatase [Ramlibacter sp.]|uniref:ferrochelatase n=1 Tax=Ramlibacter sp. TaxID=1917967 RepID=UPI002C3C2BEE|nr:ferrochelatase [Ramlibacter sp.]HVZ43468.1 ferrochelatase [Ramlibacter sp.]
MPFANRYRPEPKKPASDAPGVGILLANLGTPDEPTPKAVRRYLAEFLADSRVVEIPRVLWLPILNGLILPRRSRASAAKYASIWTRDGSPLKVWTEKQAKRLQGWLGQNGHRAVVLPAMRYGNPPIAQQLDALKAAGATRILVLPCYPQYSITSTASVIDAVTQWTATVRTIPELRFANGYHEDKGYIQAIARKMELYWRANGQPDHFVMSFHGVPERIVRLGDPYQAECERTALLIATRLMLEPSRYTVCYQSRFGRAKWIGPATDITLRELAKKGAARVDVACPGFTSDCLETLEEIAMEGRQGFLTSGGREFHYIPCLNDDTDWIAALGNIALSHLGGWPTARS